MLATIMNRVRSWFAPVEAVAQQDCTECFGNGYDAAGARCTCVLVVQPV